MPVRAELADENRDGAGKHVFNFIGVVISLSYSATFSVNLLQSVAADLSLSGFMYTPP